MKTDEERIREDIVRWSRSLFERGFTVGSSGNISVRLEDGFLSTPTNSCLGFLEPGQLSRLNTEGRHIGGNIPTKELPLHMAFYEARSTARAVVHLHSTYATALSCLSEVDPDDAIAPVTPYVVMRVGRVSILKYTKPGCTDIVPLIRDQASRCSAVLLGNHGPVVAGTSLSGAVFAAEELEESAKLILLTRGLAIRTLDAAAVADLENSFCLR